MMRNAIALTLLLSLATTSVAQLSVGPADNTIGSGANYTFLSDGLRFDVTSPTVINFVNVYPFGAGDVVINLLDSAGVILQTATTTVGGPGVATIPLGFAVGAGTGFQLNAVGTTTGGLYRNTSGGVYPYSVPGVLDITGPINNLSGYYYFFYNWNIGGTPPPPYYQVNGANASLDVDGDAATNPYTAPTPVLTPVGTTSMVNLGSALVGTGYDVLITGGGLAAANAGTFGFNTPDAQAVNINIADPTGIWLNGGSSVSLTSPFPGNFGLPVTPTSGLHLYAQGLFVDPASLIGVTLTSGVDYESVPCSASSNFDSLTTGAGAALGVAWTNGSGGHMPWTVHTGGTGSTGTGPTAAFSPSNYIYCETSVSHPATYAFDPCAFSLSNASTFTISFQLSRIGLTMGTLEVQMDDTGTGNNFVTLPGGTFTGPDPTQTQGGIEWTAVSVPWIPSGASNSVLFRFFYTTTTSFTADIAIDDLVIQ